ncbi:MAG: hypothetical protein LBD19_02260 [Endomicrobium sp.]|jgi:hypothetical protein|nr:hypothetical protein [Endomicrobium sp.]
MNKRNFLIFFTIFITVIFLTSCSKDEIAKVRDKALDRISSSPSSTPIDSSAATSAHEVPAVFRDLYGRITNLTNDANTFVSQYYPDLTLQSPLAQDLRQSFDALPSFISEAINIILCNNTNDGSNTLNFQGISVCPSTISSVISKMEECMTALSTANSVLSTFCTDDPVLINITQSIYLSNTIDELVTSLNETISQLRNIH